MAFYRLLIHVKRLHTAYKKADICIFLKYLNRYKNKANLKTQTPISDPLN